MLRICMLVTVAVSALASCAAPVAVKDTELPLSLKRVAWAMYQHSPDRNAVFEHYRIARDWSYTADKINGGLALVGNTLLFTTFDRRLVALDVRNGRELWHAALANIAMSTPIVAGDTVYVGTGKNGVLDRSLRPNAKLARNVAMRFEYGKRPVWGVDQGDEIAAFDLHTGARRWTHRTVGENMPSAVYDRGTLIFANGEWRAYALRAETGAALWSTELGGVATMASAVTAGNLVVFGTCTDGMRNSSAVALDESAGKLVWRSPYGHCDAAPTYADGKVFVSSVAPGDTWVQGRTVVAALDAKTGKPAWVYRAKEQGLWSLIGSEEAAVAGAYANGTYYQSSPLSDEVIAFDGKTGRVRWRFHTSGPAKMSAVVNKGRLYIGDTAGLFYTLDASDGTLLEIRQFKNGFTTSPPIVAGNKIIIANGTGVHAIPLSGRPDMPNVGWGVTRAMQERENDS